MLYFTATNRAIVFFPIWDQTELKEVRVGIKCERIEISGVARILVRGRP